MNVQKCTFKLYAKSGPLVESGDFGENSKFGWRKWRKIARGLAIQIGCQSGPLERGDFGDDGIFGEIGDFGETG